MRDESETLGVRPCHGIGIVSLGAVLGGLAVGLGAFGAHGLESMLANEPDGAERLEWWATAAHYQLVHAAALVAVGAFAAATGRTLRAVAWCLGLGVLFFSGTLYAMTLGAPRWFGAITPIGGVLLIAGWVGLAISTARMRTRAPQLPRAS